MASLTLEAQNFLAAVAAFKGKPLLQMSPGEARAASEAFIAQVQGSLEPMAAIEDFLIPSHIDDSKIPVRLYKATDTQQPLMIYLHGGGWVRGSIKTYDAMCRRFAAWTGHHVLSVGYRLAPEHKFPTAVNDAESAWRWVVENAQRLTTQADQLVIVGDSAGANLTAAVMARFAMRGEACSPKGVVLLYPSTDMTFSFPSMETLGTGFFLTKEDIFWYRDHYMNHEGEYTSVDASPIRSPHLSKFPRTIIITAGCDPLVDDGVRFAEALRAHNVLVSYRCFEGVLHGFMNMFTIFPEAEQAIKWLGNELKQKL